MALKVSRPWFSLLLMQESDSCAIYILFLLDSGFSDALSVLLADK